MYLENLIGGQLGASAPDPRVTAERIEQIEKEMASRREAERRNPVSQHNQLWTLFCQFGGPEDHARAVEALRPIAKEMLLKLLG